jgi:glyoxylase-like metal-dependent hydrolase (beta-lactamase superfamily II)
MPDNLPEYEVFAIRYATREARSSGNFIGGDPHDVPMPLDYYVWVIKGAKESILVDLGFTAETAARLKREHLRCPIDSLHLIGVDPASIKTVIVTHLHYDHVGNFHKLPNAEFHLQEPEIHYAVGRHMRHHFLNHGFNVDDIVGIVRLNYAARVRFHNGPKEIAPGITLHPVGGHSPGLQFVRVHTKRGWVVLASDVTHFYANMERGKPFPAVVNTADMLEAYDRLREAAPTPEHIVPGHDPMVMQIYPAPSPELNGIVVRLDTPPKPRRNV